ASDTSHVVATELQTIAARMRLHPTSATVIPVLRSGTAETALPPFLQDTVSLDFCADDSYFEHLFDLILRIHNIPYVDPAVRDLRQKVRAFELPAVANLDALANPEGS